VRGREERGRGLSREDVEETADGRWSRVGVSWGEEDKAEQEGEGDNDEKREKEG
jgi:hypothetical protein